jgi:8-oxo-dGTP pyrophosphatase MutT (NUDIX family)
VDGVGGVITGDGTIRAVGSRTVYRNAWMTVREDDVRRPDGSTGIYGVVDKPDFALTIPATPDGFHLVQQYRYPVGGRFWEFPQGSWGAAGGDDDDASGARLAAAELREETGLHAATMIHLGRIHVAYGYASQGCQVFLARDLTVGHPDREATEADMVHRFVTHDELDALIRDGALTDATSLAALTLLDRWEAARSGRTRRSEP